MSRCMQQGASLIEVLVAVVIFSLAILGLAAMQLNALKANQSASVRSHAVFLAYEMADRMRAGRGDAQAGLYDLALDAELACVPSAEDDCLPFQRDQAQWRANLASQLPDGTGGVARDGQRFTITVQWTEERVGGSPAQQFSFVTQI
ncbi:type IV pilus modification protein PilV [Pseudomonas sp. AOB-7]|uniref:type IV pilus modification protein PilV n=1 Tax=unclassified Pseudomonas TaxID=196821 RepID=UPI000EFC29D4|nr:type IV pilus modification protein PilV [Pseudomonas sp. AOB-7]RMH85490.1 type IV pilus modification protein PilV [Pseudomonas sp. AOB-7]